MGWMALFIEPGLEDSVSEKLKLQYNSTGENI